MADGLLPGQWLHAVADGLLRGQWLHAVADGLLPGQWPMGCCQVSGRWSVAGSVADGLLPGQWLHAVGDGCRFAPHCTTWTSGVPSTWRLKEAGDGGAASEGVRCSFMDCSSINYHVL